MRIDSMGLSKTLRSESGYALVAVLLVLGALTGLVVVAHANSRMDQRMGANAAVNTRAYYAAEAGAENLLAAVRQKMDEGLITIESVAEIDPTPPTIKGFTFSEYQATLSSSITTRSVTQGTWAGLVSLDRDLLVASAVEGPSDSRAAITLTARVQTMPIFQFGVFYNEDLEVLPGPIMNFEGRVHTNGELYVDGGSGLYFYEMVTAAGDLHLHRKALGFPDGKKNYILKTDATWEELRRDTHNYGGDDDPATFPSAAQDKSFDDYSASKWDHMVQTRASGIEPLTIPVPDGVDPYSLIEPCSGTESAELQPMKYACNADLVFRVRAGTVEVTDGDGVPVTLDDPTAITFLVNRFYDDREQASTAADNGSGTLADPDDAVEWNAMCSGTAATYSNSNRDVIRIQLNKILKDEYGNGVFYVTADSVGPGGTVPGCMQQYVVRVQNGNRLKNPLSIATNLPMYVKDDFNNYAGKWKPASLVADAITILSNNWQDSQSGEGATENAPTNTTINAAILAGHSPTPFPGAPVGGGQFENFPRFLEKWSGQTLTLLGSFVSLWYPQVTQAPWFCCWYYSPPNRNWSFDTRFRDPALMPPLTPLVGQILRVGFVRRY
jgi:Tfp pilus assembly protein PilX